MRSSTKLATLGLLFAACTLAFGDSPALGEAQQIYSEEMLLGSWIGGRSLIPITHTFQKDQKYSFGIEAKFNGGTARSDPGKWALIWGNVLVWRTKDGTAMAEIQVLEKNKLEFTQGTKRFTFQRIPNPQ